MPPLCGPVVVAQLSPGLSAVWARSTCHGGGGGGGATLMSAVCPIRHVNHRARVRRWLVRLSSSSFSRCRLPSLLLFTSTSAAWLVNRVKNSVAGEMSTEIGSERKKKTGKKKFIRTRRALSAFFGKTAPHGAPTRILARRRWKHMTRTEPLWNPPTLLSVITHPFRLFECVVVSSRRARVYCRCRRPSTKTTVVRVSTTLKPFNVSYLGHRLHI